MKRRVVITGMGAVTPLGNSVPSFWDGLINGRNGVRRITRFDPSPFTSQIAGEVVDFHPDPIIDPKEARRMELFTQYAIVAAHEAVTSAQLNPEKVNRERVGVIVGSGIGGMYIFEQQHSKYMEAGSRRISPFFVPMMILDMASGQVSIKFGFSGPNFATTSACATAVHAIGTSYRLLQFGDADAMITGGTEGAICEMGVGGFCAMKALSTRNHEPEKASRPFDKDRDGFIIAEGAGIVVLETLEHALKRNAPILAEIIGIGFSGDAYHITAPDPDGDGAKRAMEAAIADSGIPKEEIDYLNAHGTSTQHNDRVESIAIRRVFNSLTDKLPVSSTKSMTGHLLGAAGAVEFIATIMAVREGTIPPTMNHDVPGEDCDLDYVPNQARKADIRYALNNSFGFGGHNACTVVSQFKE
jgi:3-oxoacyl-[acyl-carrier-protein] synthase II